MLYAFVSTTDDLPENPNNSVIAVEEWDRDMAAVPGDLEAYQFVAFPLSAKAVEVGDEYFTPAPAVRPYEFRWRESGELIAVLDWDGTQANWPLAEPWSQVAATENL